MEERTEFYFNIWTVLGCMLVALIVGATVGAAFLSGSDSPKNESIEGWRILHEDVTFNSMGGEDQINLIIKYIAEGSDPRPAWPIVTEMLNNAFATIYSEGFVDCQEKCEEALADQEAFYQMTK